MNISRRVRTGTIALLLAGTAAGGAAQTNGGTPPQTIPGLDDFNLPSSQPTPAPTPPPTPQVTSAPTPVPVPVPTPVATPVPRATAAATARATPRVAATVTPTSTPTPAPVPTVAPTPDPTPMVTAPVVASNPRAVTPAAQNDWTGWAIGVGLALIFAAAIVWYRRARGARTVAGRTPPQDRQPIPAPQPVIPPPPHPPAPPAPAPLPADRAHLLLTLVPRRAGLNLLSATVEGELLVRNAGGAPATGIRIGATLTGATAGPEGDVAALFAQPVARPITPPFALAPGEERRVRVVVALPRTDIRSLAASGREMFVPVVAINVLYQAGSGEGQAAQAFAVGIERVDSAKLAPLWLDQPPRMYDGLGMRPYAVAIAR